MILHGKQVEQAIDGDERGTFLKELVLFRAQSACGEVPLAMVRKRSVETAEGSPRARLLLVHGYGQNRYAWHLPGRSFVNYLAAEGFDVYNLDLRGHGRSRHFGAKRCAHETEFAREDVPAAVAEIERLSGEGPVFLLGHSLGGLVSCAAATRLGDKVAGVVTLGMPYMFTRGSWILPLFGRLMLALDRRVPLGEGALALKVWGELVRMLRFWVESPVFPSPVRGFAPGTMEPRVLGQHMSLAMDAGSITVMRNMFRQAAVARASGHRLGGGLEGFAEAFEALDVPLLVIAGAKDDLAPPASVAPAYERSRSSDKTYRVFPQGHIDLVVGRAAPQTIWPFIVTWLEERIRRAAEKKKT